VQPDDLIKTEEDGEEVIVVAGKETADANLLQRRREVQSH